ncbi:GWxTD domain-containing protein [Reichenbachiella ulvae]|uniref:GWxTD domain-containing protein n=1 Tax=Reichenbachiella ulvae TaxID=2980104 RepID=A0ABT3CWR1_9BACT|nr:GWxTD domain-containing protein [Reichenbachiella ulvae]MCV9388042.1 GWxTD domain-containing protein [Reichenbachiella ulvae]
MIKTILMVLFLLGWSFKPAQAIDLSKINHSNNYRKSGVRFSHSIAKTGREYHLIVALRFQRYSGLDKIENFQLLSQEKFNSSKHTEIPLDGMKKRRLVPGEEFEMRFETEQIHNYLVVAFEYATRQYYFDIPINENLAFPLADFLCVQPDTNRMHNDFSPGEKISLIDQDTSQQTVFIFQYDKHAFDNSVPPMVLTLPDSTQVPLDIKKRVLKSDSIILDSLDRLSFIQKNEQSSVGQMCFASSGTYPKLTLIEEVIVPLVYISTSEEYQKVMTAEDKKEAFENFWLKIIPSKKTAANTIKEYYQRIEEANSLFTSYKEGWKTDQGMIYTIYGPPDVVDKEEQKEIWKYSVYQGEITFTFAKHKNLFTQYHYVLERDKSYSGIWFSEVKKWRKGIL